MTVHAPLFMAERRPRLLPAAVVLAGVLLLTALGVWQVQRLQWKTHLLASIAALQSAPPEPLGVVLNRLVDRGPDRAEVNFVRAQTDCPRLQQTPTLRLYSLLDGVMGYRLITACPLAGGGDFRSLLVDRGFVAREDVDRITPGPLLHQPVIGVLRKAEPISWLSPPNGAARNDWHSRDVAAMAAGLGAPAPAPVFLMLESPRPSGFGPRPAAVPTDIPNNHLGYALTWFGLALGLAGVYIASLVRGSRDPGGS